MENASDALIMAGQMLIFIIALTVCISSFTTVRAEVNRIVGENEEIRMARNGDTYINYIESKRSSSTRVIGSDALIASMYRAIKEDYVIYIKFNSDIRDQIDTSHIKTMVASVDSVVTLRLGFVIWLIDHSTELSVLDTISPRSGRLITKFVKSNVAAIYFSSSFLLNWTTKKEALGFFIHRTHPIQIFFIYLARINHSTITTLK